MRDEPPTAPFIVIPERWEFEDYGEEYTAFSNAGLDLGGVEKHTLVVEFSQEALSYFVISRTVNFVPSMAGWVSVWNWRSKAGVSGEVGVFGFSMSSSQLRAWSVR